MRKLVPKKTRPETSWTAKVNPKKSPLKGLTKANPEVQLTAKQRKEADENRERVTRPYRSNPLKDAHLTPSNPHVAKPLTAEQILDNLGVPQRIRKEVAQTVQRIIDRDKNDRFPFEQVGDTQYRCLVSNGNGAVVVGIVGHVERQDEWFGQIYQKGERVQEECHGSKSEAMRWCKRQLEYLYPPKV